MRGLLPAILAATILLCNTLHGIRLNFLESRTISTDPRSAVPQGTTSSAADQRCPTLAQPWRSIETIDHVSLTIAADTRTDDRSHRISRLPVVRRDESICIWQGMKEEETSSAGEPSQSTGSNLSPTVMLESPTAHRPACTLTN
jgi:hypothetical protein